MKTPKKKEVIKYFESAKEVESLAGTRFKFNPSEKIVERSGVFRYEPKGTSLILWNPTEGYAKILSYKEPKEKTYKITREQIKQLKHNAFHENNQLVVADINNWFPEVFEEHKTELFSTPILSLNNLLSVWADINDVELYKTDPLFKKFEQVAEAKLKELGVNAKIV